VGETALELTHAKKVRRVEGDNPCDVDLGNQKVVAADFEDPMDD
jgi:hypothetical protein